KDRGTTVGSTTGNATSTTATTATTAPASAFVEEWYTRAPSAPCPSYDTVEVNRVAVKADLYQPGMITADAAKGIALCAVPGQVGSGEMENMNGTPVYKIDVIPN